MRKDRVDNGREDCGDRLPSCCHPMPDVYRPACYDQQEGLALPLRVCEASPPRPSALVEGRGVGLATNERSAIPLNIPGMVDRCSSLLLDYSTRSNNDLDARCLLFVHFMDHNYGC